jgi:hypothetical protein
MFTILPGIASLVHHLQHLVEAKEDYRPRRCPSCNFGRLWCHGSYDRKADRTASPETSLNPVPIPRFYCPSCERTCSTLPECIPPRRWYLWAVQQALLVLLCAGVSLAKASHDLLPCEATLGRWWRGWQADFPVHGSVLRQRFPDLGRSAEGPLAFWENALALLSFDQAMRLVHLAGHPIP